MDDTLDAALLEALTGLEYEESNPRDNESGDGSDVGIGCESDSGSEGDRDKNNNEKIGIHLVQHLDPIDRPHLQPCHPYPKIRVSPPHATRRRQAAMRFVEGSDIVMRAHDPDVAYMRIHSKPEISLDHHASGWGCVFFAMALDRIQDFTERSNRDIAAFAPDENLSLNVDTCVDNSGIHGVFQAPESREAARYVAIKRLSLSVVRQSIAQGKKENPFVEISRMQQFGDGVHILPCLEALIDSESLFIVTPYCEQSLVSWIPWKSGVSEAQARDVLIQILQNLIYLQDAGLCHRDVSPDNCFIHNGRVVFADLAMSFRLPIINSTTGSHALMDPLGAYGKPAYLPPEVFFNLPFDPRGVDLWSSMVILFNLVTGELLYKLPHPDDVMFRYFILAGGFSNEMNERTTEVFMGLQDKKTEQSALWTVAQRCMSTLSEDLLDLFRHVLTMAAHERWKLTDVIRCRWIQQEPRGTEGL